METYKNAHGIDMPVENYRIGRKSTESKSDFETRIANEIRTMDVNIIKVEIKQTECNILFCERSSNY